MSPQSAARRDEHDVFVDPSKDGGFEPDAEPVDILSLRFILEGAAVGDEHRLGCVDGRQLPQIVEPVSLGEGGTPLLRADRFAARHGVESLWIKDESLNPTQTFKARGMSVAVSMAKHLGAASLAVPSAGNAGGALAAYAARAGLPAHIFMPRDTPRANIIESQELGAHVTLIDGLITDCGAEIARRKETEGWFEMSTLKEPYRLEGKKTLGYELAEQLGWELPDLIVYPTGGGTGHLLS